MPRKAQLVTLPHPLEVLFIGPAGETRWGYVPHNRYNDIKEAKRVHRLLCRGDSCQHPGCLNPVQKGKPHSWTCSEHDPVRAKRVNACLKS